ncbi:glycosyltransferase family 2 protein [Parafilimonas sp.]|uniref:glycosyltransferase family 2 protein n=1 Tax=Parafilimonas sp. TaxID=1969739 RepID=UPI003F809B21
MNFPAVAIVILNYNGRNFLEQFLPSVFASTYPNKRIIIADNASTDDSIDYLKNNFPSAELIMLDKNYGFAGGYNEALKKVASDYYVLLNSDVEVTPGWIEDMIDLMASNKNIAACQPKVRSYHNKKYFEYAGACGGWIDTLGYAFARGRIFDVCEEDTGQYNTNEKVFWATGAALCIRATCFHEMDGFDAYFFAHMEEIDLCWRLQRTGYAIYCCASSTVYHVGGGTLARTNSRKTYLNFRNNLIMLFKNLPFSEAVWKMPLRILLDWVFAFKSLLQKDATSFKAVLQAHAGVIKWMVAGSVYQKLPSKKIKEISGVYNASLIWAYFIKKKKHFSEIMKEDR